MRLKHQFIIGRGGRFQQKDLYLGTCSFVEMDACLDNAGVVEHHECACGQIIGQTAKGVVTDVAMTIDKQFARVALGHRKFGYALIGQIVLIIFDLYMSCIYHIFIELNKDPQCPHHGAQHSGQQHYQHHIDIRMVVARGGVLRRDIIIVGI